MNDNIFLCKREQFSRAARRGKIVTGSGWHMRYTVTRRPSARLGLVVPKRIIRRATSRNRLRRIIRESFRQQWRRHLPSADIIMSLLSPPSDEETARRECFNLLSAITKL